MRIVNIFIHHLLICEGCGSLMTNVNICGHLDDALKEKVLKTLSQIRHFGFEGAEGVSQISLQTFMKLMPNLTSLSFAYYSFDIALLKRYKNALTSLNLSGTTVNLRVMRRLVYLFKESLRELRLGGAYAMDDNVYVELRKFKRLRLLALNNVFTLCDYNIIPVLRNMPRLEHLDLTACVRLTDTLCEILAQLKR